LKAKIPIMLSFYDLYFITEIQKIQLNYSIKQYLCFRFNCWGSGLEISLFPRICV